MIATLESPPRNLHPSKRDWYHIETNDGFLKEEGWTDEQGDFLFRCGYWAVSGGRMYTDYINISQMFHKR